MLAVTGVAHAQPTSGIEAAASTSTSAEMPWFQRFTSSSGLTETIGADGQNSSGVLPPAWTMNQRWGVTVDVRDARRVEQGAVSGTAPGQTSVGAFYQFTPRVRVGGALNIGAGVEAPAPRAADESAGVRIESAFRF